jgi:hypothetical protein
MDHTTRVIASLSFATTALLLASSAKAQSVDDRIARADGTVRFSFQPKPGVCGDGAATIYIQNGRGGQRVQISGNSWNYSNRHSDEWAPICQEGPARIALTVDRGRVTSVRTYVGGEWRSRADVTDLGRLGAADAANYLLTLAERATSSVSRDAMFAATLADAEIWRRFLRIANNTDVPREVRKQAIFWLGQEAAQAATRGLQDLIENEEEIELRKQAIFAISQRPNDESVPALIALARRKDIDPRLRQQALFWLGQKDDPRALALFEQILLRN